MPGHKDQTTILRIYSHALPKDDTRAAEMWDVVIGDLRKDNAAEVWDGIVSTPVQ